jgi:hypothetical protein
MVVQAAPHALLVFADRKQRSASSLCHEALTRDILPMEVTDAHWSCKHLPMTCLPSRNIRKRKALLALCHEVLTRDTCRLSI